MKEPERLARGSGPARELMTGAAMQVPGAARKRALAFTKVAVGMTASSTALAGSSAAMVKTWLLTVSLGAAGGGLASLAATEAYSHFQTSRPASSAELVVRKPKLDSAPAASASISAPVASSSAMQPAAPESTAELSSGPHPSGGKAKLERKPQAPAGAATGHSGEPARKSLFEEQRVIESARAAVARGDTAGALKALDAYEQGYAERQFGPEALALRVEALAAAGQLTRARALAKDFELRYPHHPLLARVQSVVVR